MEIVERSEASFDQKIAFTEAQRQKLAPIKAEPQKPEDKKEKEKSK